MKKVVKSCCPAPVYGQFSDLCCAGSLPLMMIVKCDVDSNKPLRPLRPLR